MSLFRLPCIKMTQFARSGFRRHDAYDIEKPLHRYGFLLL
jgi:hypothetical protein